MKKYSMILFLGLIGLVGHMYAMEEVLSKNTVVVKLADGEVCISEEQFDYFKEVIDEVFSDALKKPPYELPGLAEEGFNKVITE